MRDVFRRCRPVLTGVLAAALLWAGSLPAQSSAAQPPAASSSTEAKLPPVPLLWKVSNGERSLYLLGSFHLLKPDDYPLSDDVTTVQAAADRLVLELSPGEMDSPELAMKMLAAAMRHDGTMLDSDLPPKLAAGLQAWTRDNAGALKKAQIPPQSLQMFHPWFAGLTISLVEMGNFGLDPALGLDNHVAAAARGEQPLPSLGLETGDEQIAFLAGMGLEEQLQFLDEALGGSGRDGQEEIAKLHGMWRAGDADGLWQQMAVPMRDAYPDLYARINVQRNDAWIPKLEALLADAGFRHTLVVVGALHLLGEDGVVDKLRGRGYRVERICSACPR
ncbi:MAG: TraB/GumN family protein [Pseudoxanthomonas suwonensis]|nr:TraB/GumN family protein [Pseudoxanthomonas suwonensis]